MPQSETVQRVLEDGEQQHLLRGVSGLPEEQIIEALRAKGQRAFRIARLRRLRCAQ